MAAAAVVAAASGVLAKVPVTIVTGALGAGKSTLLRHILTARHGVRIAVIENEFADSGGLEGLVLKDGVEGAVAEGFVELANGCLCCSARDSLVTALATLMRARSRFDYILVETSGLADPGPVASVFWSDAEDVETPVVLDGIVAVADAAHVMGELARRRGGGGDNEVALQLGYADVVLLNKADLFTGEAGGARGGEAALRGVEAEVGRVSGGGAPILRCIRGVVPLEAILHLRAYDTDGARGLPPALPEGVGADVRAGGGREGGEAVASGNHHHHNHGDGGCAACDESGGGGGGGGAPGGATDASAARSLGRLATPLFAGAGPHAAHDPSVGSLLLMYGDKPLTPPALARVRAWVGELLWERRVPGTASAEDAGSTGPSRGGPTGGVDGGDGGDSDEGGGDESPPQLAAANVASDGAGGGGGNALRVLRGKGVLFVAGGAAGGGGNAPGTGGVADTTGAGVTPYLLQSVHELFELEEATGAGRAAALAPSARISRVLLIGQGLPGAADALRRSFREACEGL